MERTVEAVTHLDARPERVIELLSTDPAGVLTGTPAPGKDFFLAEIAVELGGGASLAVEVNLAFGRLRDEAGVGRFGLSWRAHEHEAVFPGFGGDLQVLPDGTGTRLRLTGRYRPPLGAMGAFGDGLVGHRVARRTFQGFLDVVSERVQAALAAELVAAVPGPGPTPDREEETAGSELYLG